MKRRNFLKSSLAITALGATKPNSLFGTPKRFLFKQSNIETDRIVVFIKLNGGNDGLNTIIPYQDPMYYQLRPQLAIPADQSIQLTNTLALHPALESLLPFYENSKMSIIQGVGYPNGNLSHFRSSDIWDTGSSEDEELITGWIGRLLELEYPGFPENSPEYPLGIQFNSANLIEFKTAESNTALYLYDPDTMYAIITGNYVNEQDEEIPDTYGGDELGFLREMDYMSYAYSQIINEAANNAPNTVLNYPDSIIGQQFEITARLIAGGLETPFYRLNQNGYDTHIDQVGSSPSYTGIHNTLLSDLSNSLSVFLSEMDALGLLEKVLVITTSEFGRRAIENASLGTDHGTSAPILAFGAGINGGIFGNNPQLNQLDNNGNLNLQFDYRQIYSTIITDWLGLNQEIATNVFGQEFEAIPFVQTPLSVKNPPLPAKFKMHPAFPNPFNPTTTLSYTLPKNGNVTIRLLDLRGRVLKTHRMGKQNAGKHLFKLDGRDLSSGSYMAQVEGAGSVLNQKITLLK